MYFFCLNYISIHFCMLLAILYIYGSLSLSISLSLSLSIYIYIYIHVSFSIHFNNISGRPLRGHAPPAPSLRAVVPDELGPGRDYVFLFSFIFMVFFFFLFINHYHD